MFCSAHCIARHNAIMQLDSSPAFDDISEDSSNKNSTSTSSMGRRSHHHHHHHHQQSSQAQQQHQQSYYLDRKMNIGPAYRGSYKEDIVR